MLYIPRPREWNWDNIAETEVVARLARAQQTVDRLTQWEQAAIVELRMRQQQLWELLPEAMLSTVQVQHAQLESLAKELWGLQKMKTQALKAVKDIREHLDVIREVEGSA